MEHDGWTYIFLMCGRKAWHFDPLPDGWEQAAYQRGDYVECYVFRKPTANLVEADKSWVESYGERPGGEWSDPSDWTDPRVKSISVPFFYTDVARPESVREAREFLVDRYIRVHKITGPEAASRDLIEQEINKVLDIMDCRPTELALRFGWVDPPVPVTSLQIVDERLRKLTSVIGYMLDGLKYSIRGDNDEAAKIVAGARGIFIKLLEGKS